MIYFIANKKLTAIKIGYTSNPKQRFSGLQVAMEEKLNVILLIEGNKKMESNLHMLFEEYSLSGEWFTYNKDIKDFISDNKNKCLKTKYGIFSDSDYTSRIKLCRKIGHYSLAKIGRKLGISKQSVMDMEMRETKGTISLRSLERAANAMGYELKYDFIPVKKTDRVLKPISKFCSRKEL